MKTSKKLLIGAGLAVGATVLVKGLSLLPGSSGVLERFELASWDVRQRLFATFGSPPDPRIKLILLDQTSLEWAELELDYKPPWPRELYVPIISFCRDAGARAIAFDVLFTEQSRESVDDDRAFAKAMSQAPFVGSILPTEGESGRNDWPTAAPRWDLGSDLYSVVSEPLCHGLDKPRADFYCDDLIEGPTAFGHVFGEKDDDGVIRKVFPLLTFDGVPVPMLGLAAYLVGEEAPPHLRWMDGKLEVGDRSLFVDELGRCRLRFRAPDIETGTGYPAYRAAAVIQSQLAVEAGEEPTISPEVFRDSYVFFGFSAPVLKDVHANPQNAAGLGVEVHAALLDNLLHDTSFCLAPPLIVLSTTLLLCGIASIGTLFVRRAHFSGVGASVLLMLPVFVSGVLYVQGIWWPVVEPELSVAISLLLGVGVSSSTEGRQRRFITDAFQHYLSPTVIDMILDDPSRLELGGERRELSIFFSDLEGFSTISERLEPTILTRLLNDYLTQMTDIILEEGGTLDKYEGDAIIAFWNAPLDQPDHALRACRTAVRCQQKLAEKRPEYEDRTGAVLKMRIGVNTGPVVVGNLGSTKRFDYTVLGDAANLAARLEGANKRFGTYLMVAEATWKQSQAVSDELVARPIGRIQVVGRKAPELVLEPLGFAGDVDFFARDRFEEAWELCNEKRWREAIPLLEELSPDPLVDTYLLRLRRLVSGEEEDWDGVWKLTEK